MTRTIVFGVGAAVLGWLVGGGLGATLGGNLLPDVEIFGTRGYEATGLVVALAGAATGALLVRAAMRSARPRSRAT